MEKPTIGITLVGCLNIFFGLIAFFLAIMFMSIPLTIVLCVKALLGFISGVGLLYVKLWAWLLAVIVCIISLIEFALHPTIAFPLELLVLPYLIIKRKEGKKMSKVAQLLFLTRKKDSRIGYLLTFGISWIVFATLLSLSGGAGAILPFMKDWPMWFVWIIDIALVCWPIPLVLDISLAFSFVSSWFLFWLVATPSDLIRSWLQPYVGEWIVTPWPDIAIECLLVTFICLIFLPIQPDFNRLIEKILRKEVKQTLE